MSANQDDYLRALAAEYERGLNEAPTPTSGNDEVEAMCETLLKSILVLDKKEHFPAYVSITDSVALLRKQAEKIDWLVRLNKSTLETATAKIAELQKDAARWQTYRNRDVIGFWYEDVGRMFREHADMIADAAIAASKE